MPAEPGGPRLGHVWRWDLEPLGPALTRVTHTYGLTNLIDEKRFGRGTKTTARGRLQASLDRLADLAESEQG